jgi:4'-phosphopantetheinyl transferase
MVISPNEIHLWYAYNEEICDPHLLFQYHKLLNLEESAQQKKFYFEKDRSQYLITRAMVRSVLSLYLKNTSPEQLKFEKNYFGKPYLKNDMLDIPLCFNISHTDKLIVIAVTLDQEVGVDVEYLDRGGDVLNIASSFFSPPEIEQLFNLPIAEQHNRFFDLWTLKEAYIKACGMGLSIPLDHFSYSFSRAGGISINFLPERDDRPEYWRFWQINPTKTHKLALALKADTMDSDFSISMRKIIPLREVVTLNYPIAQRNESTYYSEQIKVLAND